MLRFLATVLLVPLVAFIANERLLLIDLDSYKGEFLERICGVQQHHRHSSSSSSSMAASPSTSSLHIAPHETPQPAFLYVTAEPGELATDDEFNGEDEEKVTHHPGSRPDAIAGLPPPSPYSPSGDRCTLGITLMHTPQPALLHSCVL